MLRFQPGSAQNERKQSGSSRKACHRKCRENELFIEASTLFLEMRGLILFVNRFNSTQEVRYAEQSEVAKVLLAPESGIMA